MTRGLNRPFLAFRKLKQQTKIISLLNVATHETSHIYLECLSNKTVKKLALDVDIANQPTGEEGAVHQHCDHFS